MEDRKTYDEIRAWFLNGYYIYCRSKLARCAKWEVDEHEIGFAYEELENTFALPAERLMLEVLALVLDAGRSPDAQKFHRQRIDELRASHEIQRLLGDLPEEEAAQLSYDLKILQID